MFPHSALFLPPDIYFKLADQPWEHEAIHRLNHRTFAGEIPQHEPRPDGRLVDRFHDSNVYQIALQGTALVGMLALRFDRPFSVEQKVPESMAALPAGHQWCEVRLLSVDPRFRGSGLLAGLLRSALPVARARGCNAALISATTRQLKLYGHMGFTAFGPLIGREDAWYQPMWVALDQLGLAAPVLADPGKSAPINLLPGPVTVAPWVRAAFEQTARSHRAPEVLAMVEEIRQKLSGLTGARNIALLAGGGTLANDVVAGQLRQLGRRGVVVSGGEFGQRLADHALRAGLEFGVLDTAQYPDAGSPEALACFLDAHPDTGWVWLTHCETSTGALFDLPALTQVCEGRGVKLCADCVSSLGVVPVDLRGVWMASAASGKGLAAYPGIALVLSAHLAPAALLPRALDLHLYQSPRGMPFTLGSNLIAALHAAVSRTDWPAKFCRVQRHGRRLRQDLLAQGFVVSGGAAPASPAVLTITLPAGVRAVNVAEAASAAGFILAAHSDYLLGKNQLQACLMGVLRERDTRLLAALLARWVF